MGKTRGAGPWTSDVLINGEAKTIEASDTLDVSGTTGKTYSTSTDSGVTGNNSGTAGEAYGISTDNYETARSPAYWTTAAQQARHILVGPTAFRLTMTKQRGFWHGKPDPSWPRLFFCCSLVFWVGSGEVGMVGIFSLGFQSSAVLTSPPAIHIGLGVGLTVAIGLAGGGAGRLTGTMQCSDIRCSFSLALVRNTFGHVWYWHIRFGSRPQWSKWRDRLYHRPYCLPQFQHS